MVTVGAKFWFALAGLGLVAVVAYLAGSDSEPLGTLVLASLVVAAVILGTLHVALRDGNVPGAAAETEASVVADRTQLPAPWPALGALGVGVTAIGAAGGTALFYVGLAILVVTLFEWMVQGWAERATGDHAYNAGLRHRIMSPVEVPVVALLMAGVVLLAFSRVLLALPKAGSTVVAIVVAAAILGIAALVASRPRISSGLVSGVLVVGAVGLLGGGIVGAVAGEREFEAHEDELEATEGGGEYTVTFTEDGMEPLSLEIEADVPVTITVVNEDRQGVEHSLLIQGLDEEASSEAIGSGESTNVEVTAPAGTYTYVDGGATEQSEEGVLTSSTEPSSGGAEPEVDGGEQGGSGPDEETENSDGGETDPDDTTEVSSP